MRHVIYQAFVVRSRFGNQFGKVFKAYTAQPYNLQFSTNKYITKLIFFMKSHLLTLIMVFFSTLYAQSQQNCGCNHVVSQSGIYTQSTTPGTFNLNVLPGQTVCIMAGNYNLLRFKGFTGTTSQPIIFKNCGGLVTLGHGAYYAALDFQGCRYFRATGTGTPSVYYGFRVDSSGTSTAVSIGNLSSDSELDHIEVAKSGFAGIMAKTDPSCDPTTWRENFTMYNVNIHDNYLHDTGAEGIYVGNSFFGDGRTFDCLGVSTKAYPHNIVNLKIHHNTVKRSGAECIQYACAPNAQVYYNDLDRCGIDPFAAFQNNGMQCGGGAGGNCFNNRIRNVGGSGLAIIGHLGNNRFFNNLLVNCGGDAIFCDDYLGSLSNTFCDFINNTIINTGRDAFRLYNQNNTMLLANNVIVGAGLSTNTGACFNFQQGATGSQLNNYCSKPANVSGLFVDTVNYRLVLNSPLINAGEDMSGFGVSFDIDGKSRPMGGAFDLGASEFDPTIIALELTDFQGFAQKDANHLIWAFADTKDLDKVEVQKSKEGVHFIPLSIPNPKGETAVDISPYDVTYYRLLMTEINGKEAFSKIIAVKRLGTEGSKIKVYPNPVNNVLTIENAEGKDVTIVNALGQVVLSEKNNHSSSFMLHQLICGIYFVKVGDEVVRFVKK